jgi:hypothetical protein
MLNPFQNNGFLLAFPFAAASFPLHRFSCPFYCLPILLLFFLIEIGGFLPCLLFQRPNILALP